MPTIRCRMTDCVNWDEGYCSANRINIDDEGVCLTYAVFEEVLDAYEEEPEWDEEPVAEDEEEEEEEASAMPDDYEDDKLIRGRRRWDEW